MLTTNKVKQEGRTMRENRTDSCICACGAPGQCFYFIFFLVFLGQDVVFQCLGESLLDNAFLGYNACIFAYGQTGNQPSHKLRCSAVLILVFVL